MQRFFDKLATTVVHHRWIAILLLAIVTTVSVVGHTNAKWARELFTTEETASTDTDAGDNEPTEPAPDVDPINISSSSAVLVVRSQKFFTPNGAKAMRQVVEDLEELDQVQGILWMDRVPMLNIFGLQEPIYPRSLASKQRFDASKKKALAHPLIRGQLLSEDAETMLLMISYNWDHIISDHDATDLLRETAEATAAKFPDLDLSFQVTGEFPSAIAAISDHEANQLKYQLIGYGMILLMSVILFRGVSAVVIVALAPVLGVFWTLGIINFFEFDRNPLIDIILPIMVSLVGLTDGVHLMVQIRKLRAGGMSERDASKKGLSLVGLACFLTSLTTAIGFGSLALAESELVQQFGYSCVIGVTLCFFSVITVIPLACSTWLGRNIHRGLENSLVDKNLGRISVLIDAVLKRPTFFAITGIALTGILFSISMTLEPDERRSNNLPPNAEATLALKHMDKAMGGLEFSSVEVGWSRKIEPDDPEILEVITEIDDHLRSEELIGSPLSIRSLIDAQPGNGPPAERMSMIELLPPPLKRAFFTPERRSASVSFRVRDVGIAKYGPVFERANAKIDEILSRHPEFQMKLDGNAVWRWKNLYQIVVDLAKSLGTASIIILIVLAIVYRSLRLGLISVIPNMFPLVVTGTYLALAGYNLEIVMVCNFTICLGIAVDDTIHFLTRYREEREQSDDEHTAIRRAFTGVGTALIMTTSVLVAGFSTVIMSESRDHKIFATMGAITIAAALFGDLIFLPALLARFAPAKGTTKPKPGIASESESPVAAMTSK